MEQSSPPRMQPDTDTGLTNRQVGEQINRGLVNARPKDTEKSVWDIVRDNTITLFNLLNAGIAVCVCMVGAYRNMLFMAVVVINTLIGIVQEIRSKRLIAKLTLISMPKALVVRNGEQREIAVEEMVLDDIVILQTGRQIGADAIVQRGSIEVNEALLTGEADPVEKTPGDFLFSGSFVVSGRCHAKVEHIGEMNYATSIEKDAKRHKRIHSELMDVLNRIVRFTGAFMLPLGLMLVMRAAFLLHLSPYDMVVTTAAALIGMMPKGLVLLTSVSLAVGVIRLAKKNTLIHELFGIETLSRVDMLCLDKTGTLTEGHMRLSDWIPMGERSKAEIERAIGAFVHAQADTNATMDAVRTYFENQPAVPPTHVVPFSSTRKWSAVTFEGMGSVLMGAPDVLWPYQAGEGLPPSIAQAESCGTRVILFALSNQPVDRELPDDRKPCAIIMLSDPLRPDAREILDYFRSEGVAIKIISGDHPHTVSALASQAGLEDSNNCIDMSTVTEAAAIRRAATRYTIFGRVNPWQKRLLIQSLREAGHTVAMTGDGVNDVLALRDADCSITLASGTDAARYISQIVLLNNDFASLPSVLSEGRRVVNNITRTASLYLCKTVYSFAVIFIVVFSNMHFPFIPIQLTLIGVLLEGIPSFVLAMEPNREHINEDFFGTVLKRAVPSGLVIASLVALANALMTPLGWSAPLIGTVCVYLTGIFCSILLFKACRPFNHLRRMLWTCMTALFVALPVLWPSFFEMQPFTLAMAGWIGILSAIGLVLLWLYTWSVTKLVTIAQQNGSTSSMQQEEWK